MNNVEESFSVLRWEIPESKSCTAWNSLNVVRAEDILFVTLWNKHKATVIRIDISKISQINVSNLKNCSHWCQELTLESSVLQVFKGQGRLFFLTDCGALKAVTFDELKRLHRNAKINLTSVHSFPAPKEILRSLILNGNLLVVAAFNCHITIDIHELDSTSDSIEVFPIFSLPLEVQQEQDDKASCVLCICDKDMSSLLTGIQDDECTVVLIGLNTGSVLWVPFTKEADVQPEVKKLYHAGRSVRDIIPVQGRCCAFILLEGGVIVMVTRMDTKIGNFGRQVSDLGTLQFDMFALPGHVRTISVCVSSKNILCSDGIQCWRVKRDTDDTETACLPVKGVTALAFLPGSNICLAFTKHNTFYCINVDSNFLAKDSAECSLQTGCDLESPYQYICELKDQTDSLVNVETSLTIEDDILEGVSLAARSDILKEKLSGRVLVYNVDQPIDCDELDGHLPTDINYKVIVEVENGSSLTFSSELWNVSISIITFHRGAISKTVPLKDPLVQGLPFSAHMYLSLSSDDLVFKTKVLVNLITELPDPDRGQWISIPVIAEDLCVSHFLTVLSDSEKGMFKARTSPVDKQINAIINDSISNSTKSNSYSIRLSAHTRSVSDVMRKLLSKCRYRCEDYLKLLKGSAVQREVHLLFGDALVTLSFNQTVSTLTILSTETRILHSVKAWIIGTLAENNVDKCVPAAVVAKAKCIQSVLEREQLKSVTDIKNLEAIHSEVRTNISAMLTL